MQRKITTESPWTEDAQTSYKNYLGYAGEETNQGIQYNQSILGGLNTLFSDGKSSPKQPAIKVVAFDGDFESLSNAASCPLYCNKLVIRNMRDTSLMFHFEKDIIPGIVGIDAVNKKSINEFKIAYRNIVPNEFSEARSLAGPMGYHEYVIDGSAFTGKIQFLKFTANSDRLATPLKIVLENCNGGHCTVLGLDQKSVSEVFINKCDSKKFEFIPVYEDLIAADRPMMCKY